MADVASGHPSGSGSIVFREHNPYGYIVDVGGAKGRIGGQGCFEHLDLRSSIS